ncbi:MAG: 2-dehydropantoate 2-reductase [Aliiglaciecola sp.]
MPTHLIFGAGLIGCYLGAAIAQKNIPVTLLCRAKVRQKLREGILLSDYLDHTASIKNLIFHHASDTASTNNFDFVWLTVKCTGVESASAELGPFVGDNTVIICCQNGLGSELIVKQRFPNNIVLRAMVPFNVVEMKDGHFHRGSEGALTIESLNSSKPWLSELISSIQSDLLPVNSNAQMDALLWAKLQLNLGNSINALADIPVKAMLEQKHYRLVIAALMDELLAVTDALNITLPKVTALPGHLIPKVLRLPNFLFKLIANKMLAIDPNVRTSMWWDVSQGKPTEIDHLNGAIIEQANALDIECPCNQVIVNLVKSLRKIEPEQEKKSYTAKQLYGLVCGK